MFPSDMHILARVLQITPWKCPTLIQRAAELYRSPLTPGTSKGNGYKSEWQQLNLEFH